MQEMIAQVVTHLLGVWRHRWLVLVVAWVVALGGWAYIWKMPESYVASARLYVDVNTVLRPLLKGLAVTPDINQRVRLMSGTLFSRPNLEKLARMTDLDLQVMTENDKEDLIDNLREAITLRGQRTNQSIYDIEVKHKEREKARRIAQSLITVFIEGSLNEERDDSSGAQTFLDEQIAEYDRRLVEAEGRLARFKQQNVDVLPSKWGADYYTRLEQTRTQMRESELALQEAERRRDALKQQISGVGESDGLLAAEIAAPTDARIQQLRLREDALLTRYTEKYPEVQQIRGLIAELEAQRSREIQFRSEGAPVSSSAGNAVLSDAHTLLTAAEASVAELEVRVTEYRRREEELASKVNQIPDVEAQLTQLNRDYDVVKGQYTELLERRESARISQGVEKNASDVAFRVVDPPFVPRQPSEPNKPLLNTLVLFLALASGAGIALLTSMLKPVVVDARKLAEVTGLPLLGVVTHNKSSSQRQADRWRLASFSMCAFLLFGACGAVLLAPILQLRVAGL